MRRSSQRMFSLIVVMLLGLMLRLLWLDASPLRGDEAFAIEYWAAPWPEALALTSVEPHPYGTFALFAFWKWIFGDGEWVMRLLPALLSIPGIAATYTLGRQLFRDIQVARLAALLYALHPFLIWHAQDVRNYAIWAALSPMVMAAFWQAIHSNRSDHWRRYLLLALAAAYTFFFAIFFLITQGLYVVLMHRNRWRKYTLTGLTLGVGLIPWGLQILSIMQGSGYGGTAGAFQIGQLFTWFLPAYAIGTTLPQTLVAWLWPLLIILLIGGITLLWQHNRSATMFIVLNIVVPIFCLWIASERMDIFRPRYLMPITVMLILVIAWLARYMTTRSAFFVRMAGASLAGGLLLLNGLSLFNAHLNPVFAKAPDWRVLGEFLTTHVHPDDLVIQQAMDPSFTYYYRGPADETGLPLSANAPAEETITYLQDARPQYSAIWFLPSNIPQWDADRVPLGWLTENMQQTANLTIAGFDLHEYQSWTVSEEEFAPCKNIEFQSVASLCDWRVESLGPDTIRVTLYWAPIETPDHAVHGFVHLIGPVQDNTNTSIWSQEDHLVTDEHWQPGILRRDVYQLEIKENLAGGSWTIQFGLYDPASATRIPVDDTDHITIPVEIDLLELTTP